MFTKTKKFALPILILLSFSFAFAQQDYQKWLENEQRKLQEFKDARDKAFVEFLNKEWQAIQLFQGIVPDKTPKPTEIPKTALNDILNEITPEPSKVIEKFECRKRRWKNRLNSLIGSNLNQRRNRSK